MTHVSRKRLKQALFDEITDQFVLRIARFNGKTAKKFFRHFFTRAERIMVAKRLAVLFFLYKGFSFYRIALALKVSPSTVHRIRSRFDDEEIAEVLGFSTKGNGSAFLQELEELFFEGFSMSSSKRNAWLKKHESRHVK